MTLYYIWDAYCGWCHGFGQVLVDFVDQHPELEIEVLSGGLFNQGNPMSAYPHIPGANAQIAKIFGVTFGEGYEAVLSDGSHVMDSQKVTAGFAILKEKLPQTQWLAATKSLQNAFYHEGRLLTEAATYGRVAAAFGLDVGAIAEQVEQAWAAGSHLADIERVRAMGIASYPTVLLHKERCWYDLRQGALTLAELETNFQAILAQ